MGKRYKSKGSMSEPIQLKSHYNVHLSEWDTNIITGSSNARRTMIDGSDALILYSPIYKYNGRVILSSKLTFVIQEDLLIVDVIDQSNNTSYPFLNYEYGKSEVYELVRKKLIQQLEVIKNWGIKICEG